MRAVFVSDLHLTEPQSPRYQVFVKFLEHLPQQSCDALVLLGDVFDLWLGSHAYFLTKHKVLLGALKNLKDRGCEIHYFEGNHDLHLADYFQARLGICVHPQDFSVLWDGLRLRMEHGDLANPDDHGYLFLRKFLRHPLTTKLLKSMPGRWVHHIGDRASKASRDYTAPRSEASRTIVREYAQRLAGEDDFDILLTGHTHCRDDYTFSQGGKQRRSINLGSWFDDPIQILLLQDQQFRFVPIEEWMSRP